MECPARGSLYNGVRMRGARLDVMRVVDKTMTMNANRVTDVTSDHQGSKT